jgi:error-prone DNA polymerase
MFCEMQVATAFSFLHGASHAEELAQTAKALGLQTIGIADRNTLAGMVRAHLACKDAEIRLIPAARLVFRDGTPEITAYPTDRAAWGRLSRLLTVGKGRAKKGECLLDLADLLEYGEGQAILIHADSTDALPVLESHFRKRAWLAVTRRYAANDSARLREMIDLGMRHRLPLLATNDVLYHGPERRRLQDVMTCIRLGTTLEKAGLALAPNGERHLKSPQEMMRLFREAPHAISATEDLASRCSFKLTDLSYEYPDEPIPPGSTPDAHLAKLAWEGAAQRYNGCVPPDVQETISKELDMIRSLSYAPYFLTVHDIVHYARSQGILCQGRGSAANSVVCF